MLKRALSRIDTQLVEDALGAATLFFLLFAGLTLSGAA